MKLLSILLWSFTVVCLPAKPAGPNILFIIADDASRHFGQAYDCDWVQTPNIGHVPAYWPDNYPTVKPAAKGWEQGRTPPKRNKQKRPRSAPAAP